MAKRTSKRSKRTSRRASRNGWGRRASRGLKGKRRSRSKRTSRRNGLDRDKIQKALSYVHFVERSSQNREGVSRVAAVKQAIAHYKLSADEADVLLSATHVNRSEITANGRNRPRRNSRRRRSRANQTYYIPIPPITKNRRRSRRNSRLSASKRAKLPGSKFVFPKDRAWPIESAKGARDAIRYIKMGRVRSASDYMAIRSFIMKHYPAVWREYGLGASWQKSHAAHVKGMAHRRASAHRGHKVAANRRR